MSLNVVDPGLQCTVQAAARTGHRHAGVPASGPADSVSMALANRLVGNAPDTACLEISYGPASFRFEADTQISVTGAGAAVRINGAHRAQHATLDIVRGDSLEIGAARAGARIYMAVRKGANADSFLGTQSTYLPAGLGGFQGRALRKGDVLSLPIAARVGTLETPGALQLWPGSSYALRAVVGPDWTADCEQVFASVYHATARASRMGIEISGTFPSFEAGGLKPSSAVFPGALQVTPQGQGFLLLTDGQTTGGYPHVLQVIRADRHLLGQVRPGDSIRFLILSQVQAEQALKAKQALLGAWMPDFRL